MILLAALALIAPTSPARAETGRERASALARESPGAQRAFRFLVESARSIPDRKVRDAALALLAEPAPSFMERLSDPGARDAVRRALVEAKLLDPATTADALFPPLSDARHAPQPFWAAPGSVPGGHHAWPGGLAEHTAFNVRAALDLARNYRDRYGVDLDRSIVVVAPLMHDAMKAWALQWRDDGTFTTQARIAGTPSHHIFAVAEALHRGLPSDAVVALASAHEPPTGDGLPRVIGFLRAGAILAGVTPEAAGLRVATDGSFALAHLVSIEAAVSHLSDHDHVITDEAAAAVTACLAQLGRAHGVTTDAALRWMAHRIQSRVPGLLLYSALRRGGEKEVERLLRDRHIELVTPADRQ